jgi:hypothetical protein
VLVESNLVKGGNCHIILSKNLAAREQAKVFAWVSGIEDETAERDSFGGEIRIGEHAQRSRRWHLSR